MKNDQVGAAVHIIEGMNLVKEESYHLDPNSIVFQAETFAVGETARIIINCDSQASVMAVTSTQIKSKTTSATVSELNKTWKGQRFPIEVTPSP